MPLGTRVAPCPGCLAGCRRPQRAPLLSLSLHSDPNLRTAPTGDDRQASPAKCHWRGSSLCTPALGVELHFDDGQRVSFPAALTMKRKRELHSQSTEPNSTAASALYAVAGLKVTIDALIRGYMRQVCQFKDRVQPARCTARLCARCIPCIPGTIYLEQLHTSKPFSSLFRPGIRVQF